MTHIKTESDAEKSLKGMYKRGIDSTPVVAEDTHVATIARIVDMTQTVDRLKAAISEEKAKLMGFMQGHTQMVGPDGRVLITWKNGRDKTTVDVDKLVLTLNIPPDVVASCTVTSPGARVFKIED